MKTKISKVFKKEKTKKSSTEKPKVLYPSYIGWMTPPNPMIDEQWF